MTGHRVEGFVNRARVDGLPIWRVLVITSEDHGTQTSATLRVAWFATWERAIALADLATRDPDHPALGGIQWTPVTGRPSPVTVAERLAVVGAREPVPRIGLAAALAEVCS